MQYIPYRVKIRLYKNICIYLYITVISGPVFFNLLNIRKRLIPRLPWYMYQIHWLEYNIRVYACRREAHVYNSVYVSTYTYYICVYFILFVNISLKPHPDMNTQLESVFTLHPDLCHHILTLQRPRFSVLFLRVAQINCSTNCWFTPFWLVLIAMMNILLRKKGWKCIILKYEKKTWRIRNPKMRQRDFLMILQFYWDTSHLRLIQ